MTVPGVILYEVIEYQQSNATLMHKGPPYAVPGLLAVECLR